MSKELIEAFQEELSQAIDKFLKSTGSRHWIYSEKLESITANFSDDSPPYQLGTLPFQMFVSDCKELQKKINQMKIKEQAKENALSVMREAMREQTASTMRENIRENIRENALSLLREAIKLSTESGLLDELQGYCANPDSINDVCDAVASFKQYYFYYSWIVDECFRENESDNGLRHTTVVSNNPPKEFLSDLLNGWVEIRQFPSKEKMEEFAKTVGLGN